jgi:hypothetical protein
MRVQGNSWNFQQFIAHSQCHEVLSVLDAMGDFITKDIAIYDDRSEYQGHLLSGALQIKR